MSRSELIEQLNNHLPNNLVSDLINNFLEIKSETATGILEKSSPGKFIETVVQILQFLDKGQYEKNPKVDDYLKNLESRSANLSDDLKITLARVGRASYTLRNKRNIAHKGDVDPNIYDLRYLYSASQWILSEIVRQVLFKDMNTAGKLIEFIQIPVSPVVEDFGDKRLVLKVGTTEEELMTLLLHYFPNYTLVSQMQKDMDRRARRTVSNVITSIYKRRFIEGNRQQGYKLTTLGYQKAIEIIKKIYTI